MSRYLAVVISAAALVLAGCGGDDDPEPADSTTAAEQTTPAGEESTPAEEGSSEPAAESTVLTASVGTDADPDAFTIALTDESGDPVSELPAGDYTINVIDPSTIHNFHLTGGSVDEATSLEGVEEVTWEVTLEPGDYVFVCDPHPNMTGSFTVV